MAPKHVLDNLTYPVHKQSVGKWDKVGIYILCENEIYICLPSGAAEIVEGTWFSFWIFFPSPEELVLMILGKVIEPHNIEILQS